MQASLPRLVTIPNLEELRIFARDLAAQIRAQTGDRDERFILLLDGPMGAGKTQLTRFLTEAWIGSSTEIARSPTFAIHNSYSGSVGSLEHFDLFRVETEDDLESTGFWDFFRGPGRLIVIEWAVRLRDLGIGGQLPLSWPRWQIEISIVGDEGQRELRLSEKY